MTDQKSSWKILSKSRYHQRSLVNMLLIATGFAVITSCAITYAQDANSEQEEFNARVEQEISENYGNGYTVEKTGNLFA